MTGKKLWILIIAVIIAYILGVKFLFGQRGEVLTNGEEYEAYPETNSIGGQGFIALQDGSLAFTSEDVEKWQANNPDFEVSSKEFLLPSMTVEEGLYYLRFPKDIKVEDLVNGRLIEPKDGLNIKVNYFNGDSFVSPHDSVRAEDEVDLSETILKGNLIEIEFSDTTRVLAQDIYNESNLSANDLEKILQNQEWSLVHVDCEAMVEMANNIEYAWQLKNSDLEAEDAFDPAELNQLEYCEEDSVFDVFWIKSKIVQ